MSDFGFLMETIVGGIVKALLWCLVSPVNLILNFKKHILNLLVCIITATIFIIRLNLRCLASFPDVVLLVLFVVFLSRIGENKGLDTTINPEDEIIKSVQKK
jgi:Ca2+/Na+ antiporter